MLQGGGHGQSLEAGRVPDALIEWRVALGTHTHSMRHEREMLRWILGESGWRAGVTLADAELAAIETPILFMYGRSDPVGTAEVWSRFVDLLPNAELRLVDGAGHQPWLDDPRRVARDVGVFLRSSGAGLEDHQDEQTEQGRAADAV